MATLMQALPQADQVSGAEGGRAPRTRPFITEGARPPPPGA